MNRLGVGIGVILGIILALLLFSARGVSAQTNPTVNISNVEEVTWVDWKGRERKMVIHREVHG